MISKQKPTPPSGQVDGAYIERAVIAQTAYNAIEKLTKNPRKIEFPGILMIYHFDSLVKTVKVRL